MLHKFAFPMSPATQNAMGGAAPTESDEAKIFEQKFGEMAYQVFTAKYPELVSDVVTFKVLDSDIEQNSATGAFILDRDGEIIYIPVVLSDNQLKPMDLMYVKSQDIFLPFTEEWLDETSRLSLKELGEGAKIPETVATDVDIRNIVVPPTTGRYSYAADKSATVGRYLDDVLTSASHGAVGGGLYGAANALWDGDPSDLPGKSLRGLVGGGVGAGLGHLGGSTIGKRVGLESPMAEQVGAVLGGAGGAHIGTQTKPGLGAQLLTPSEAEIRSYYREHPEALKMSSDISQMFNHMTNKEGGYKTGYFLEFLTKAPNNIKLAFAKILDENPKLMRKTAAIYGNKPLVAALQLKEAGHIKNTGGALYVADKDTPATELNRAFGDAAPEAFRGILMRGYYFKDTRPVQNLAVQVEHYHDFHDTREPGVYRLFNYEDGPEAALVVQAPLDLLNDDRPYYPFDSAEKVKPVIQRVRTDAEFDSLTRHDMIHLNHNVKRMAVFGNGDYFITDQKLFGEQVTELFLKGTPVYNILMSDTKAQPPRAGLGFFARKRGVHYYATQPVEIKNVTTDSDGVIRGTLTDRGGWDEKRFSVDPRSPNNRIIRPAKEDFVVIPASWKWIPLKEEKEAANYIQNQRALGEIALNALNSMGSHEGVAVDAGGSMYAINGQRTEEKVAALKRLATAYDISAMDAQAILKIASVEGTCRFWAVPKQNFNKVAGLIKQAVGEPMPPQTAAGAPPAMAPQDPAQAQPPPDATQQAMPTDMMPPAMASAMPSMPPPPSPVDQAFGEAMASLSQGMSKLQAQLDVLNKVQMRAQQLASGDTQSPPLDMQASDPAETAPPDAAAPSQDPAMDPNAMQDPAASGVGAVQQGDDVSPEAIANSVNPAFLEQASSLADMGAFDAGALGSLAAKPQFSALGSEYAANLENSLDDIGRTLMTLYMQESELKEQMGDEAYMQLETQLRDSLTNIGDLLLNMSHNTTALNSQENA